MGIDVNKPTSNTKFYTQFKQKNKLILALFISLKLLEVNNGRI